MPVCRRIIQKIMNRTAGFIGEESGQSIVVAAVAFSVLIGCAALAVDLGASYAVQQKLQNAADEAAIAGARSISLAVSDTSSAIEQALEFAELNGASRDSTTVTVPYEGDPYRVEVVCTREMHYSFAGIFGRDKGTVSARAVAECQTLRGPFDYSIFSGSKNYELPFNVGNMTVGGSIHSNDDVALRSSGIVVNGDVEAVNKVIMSGGIKINGDIYAAETNKDGQVIARDEKGLLVDMPDFSDIVKEAAKQKGTYYQGGKQFYGNGVSVDDAIYVEGDVSFSSPTVVSGCGIIIATGNITFNAACVLSPSSSVCFYSKNGNIQVNAGEICVEGLLYAPNGMIQANTASFTVNGRVVADKLQFNASKVTINQGEHDRDCLPRLEIALIE